MSSEASATDRPILHSLATLLRSRDVQTLWLGAMIGRLPSGMLPLAILLLVREQQGSLAVAGFAVGAFSVARSMASPLIGAMIDRFGLARVLVPVAAAQSAFLIGLVGASQAHASVVLVVLLAGLAGGASPPVQASLRALWPVVAKDGAEREAAYSFDATTQELIWVAGPLLVAVLVSAWSTGGAILAGALVAVAGPCLFVLTPVARGRAMGGAAGRFSLGALSAPGLPAILLTGAFAGVGWGAVTLGLTGLAVGLGSRGAAGLLLAAMSLGSVAGGILYATWSGRWAPLTRYRLFLVAAAVAVIPVGFSGSIVAALPLSVVCGLPLAGVFASQYILASAVAREGTATEAFAWLSSLFALGIAAGTSFGGAASEGLGAAAPFVLAGAAFAGAVLVTLATRPR